jgi:hypothetical protein
MFSEFLVKCKRILSQELVCAIERGSVKGIEPGLPQSTHDGFHKTPLDIPVMTVSIPCEICELLVLI